MPPFQTFREGSRTDWGRAQEGGLTIEQINCGAILRTADAVEKIADSLGRLLRDREALRDENARLRRQLQAQRAQTTKARREAARLATALNDRITTKG